MNPLDLALLIALTLLILAAGAAGTVAFLAWADHCRRVRVGRCDQKALDAASEHLTARDWFTAALIVLALSVRWMP